MTPIEAAAAVVDSKVDANWFYSSLAQSAASFVGLFGAILATNVQAQHEPAAVQREKAKAALCVFGEQLQTDLKNLSDYRDHAPTQIAATRQGMADGRSEVLFDRFYHPSGFAPPNNGQACSQPIIDAEQERLELTLVLVPLLDRALKAKTSGDLLAFVSAATPFSSTPVNGMGGIVRKLVEYGDRASSEVERLELRTRTGTWGVLLGALFVVVVAGLVVPLFVLSVRNACGGFGLSLAGVFAVGLLALLIYVCVQIVQLRRRGQFATLLPPVG